jgi:hypothetical protein
MRFKVFTAAALLFAAGVACGGYLFSDSIPRAFLAAGSCGEHCYDANELAGMIASIGLLRTPALIPGVVLESDTCLSIHYPRPEGRVHYVLFPKHDVRDIAHLTPDDMPYVAGCFAMVRELVERDRLRDYVVHTNGPERQEIAYLHFHLVAD